MIKNYFRKAFRNLMNNKVIGLINLSGLVIGISSFILILLYVHKELTYDRFNENCDRIFKVAIGNDFNMIAPFAVILKDKVPEIEKIVRVDTYMGGGKSPILKIGKDNEAKKIRITDIIYADSSFFDVFSYKVIKGNKRVCLTEPNSIVLTQSTAYKLFGDENPIGRTIDFIGTNETPKLVFTVTAITEDIHQNSSIKFNGIVSFNTLKLIKPGGADVDDDFGNWTYATYVLMKKSCSVKELSRKSNEVWFNFIAEKFDVDINSKDVKENLTSFVPLADVYFYKNSKQSFIYLILLVGFIIIIIAIINFVNISLAKASLRTKEIGIKKISGSGRFDLLKQFVGETIAFTFIASVLALAVVLFLMPVFNDATGGDISFDFFLRPKFLLFYITGTVLIGIVAGIYPGLYLSGLKPIAILKNAKINGHKNNAITQSLIIFQFVIAIVLVISTVVISKQVKQMKTADLGFDDKNIITCQLTKSIKDKYDVFKQKLLQNPDIKSVTTSSGIGLAEQFHMKFSNEINGSEKTYYAIAVDPDFIKTIGFNVVEGRDFSWDLATDKYYAVIINQTAAKYFGVKDPIGLEINMINCKARVVGIIKDFHNESFRTGISPLVLWNVPGYSYNLSIRLAGNDTPETIRYIKEQWENLAPDIPFEFQFLDKKYDDLYKDENKLSLVIGYFSVIAILIACLGLFGLVSFMAESRTKEIGIRKVNGARVSEILVLLNIDFIKWITIAFVVGAPVSWYVMHEWLENFAYKANLSWWIFALAGLLTSGIALLTVSWQSWKAATRNPVEALRYE